MGVRFNLHLVQLLFFVDSVKSIGALKTTGKCVCGGQDTRGSTQIIAAAHTAFIFGPGEVGRMCQPTRGTHISPSIGSLHRRITQVSADSHTHIHRSNSHHHRSPIKYHQRLSTTNPSIVLFRRPVSCLRLS